MADKKNAKGKKKAKGSKDETKGGKPIKSLTDGDADPPIIISGGSVTIESTVFLSSSYDPVKKKFIYEAKDIKIGKINTKGKKDQDDDSDNGKFTIKLFNE